MKLRRKIALWLCPELVGSVEARVEYYPSAYELARDTLGGAEAAKNTVREELQICLLQEIRDILLKKVRVREN